MIHSASLFLCFMVLALFFWETGRPLPEGLFTAHGYSKVGRYSSQSFRYVSIFYPSASILRCPSTHLVDHTLWGRAGLLAHVSKDLKLSDGRAEGGGLRKRRALWRVSLLLDLAGPRLVQYVPQFMALLTLALQSPSLEVRSPNRPASTVLQVISPCS